MKMQHQLAEAFNMYVTTLNCQPDLIIMNPLTYEKLIEEIIESTSLVLNTKNKNYKYQGVDIELNFYVEEGKFIIK